MAKNEDRRWPRRAWRAGAVALTFAIVVLVLTWLSTEYFAAFGRTPRPAARARIVASPHFSEPAETLLNEAARRGVPIATPHLGEPIEPTGAAPTPTDAWWRSLPPMAVSCPP